MKKLYYYYNIHGLLKVKSNFNCIPNYFLVKNRLEDIDIILELVEDIETTFTYGYSQIAPGLFCSSREDSVISKFRILGLNFSWKLKGLLNNPTTVYFTKAYKDLVLMPISTIYPINDYIKFILHIKLLFKGYGFLIAACFKPEDSKSAILISSCGGMGKSTTILNLFKKNKDKYYSDDTLIISKDKIYSYPTNISVRKFGCTILHYIKKVPVTQYFSPNDIAKEGISPGKIFFLEKGIKNDILKISSDCAIKKALTINRKIIPYNMERSILGYFYYNPLFDLYGVMKQEEDMLKAFLGNLDCYILQCKDPKYWTEMILDVIAREN